MNTLRATDANGRVLMNCMIETGAHPAGRRVPTSFVRQIPPGSILEIETRRGWERRYLIEQKGVWYTRTTPQEGTP